MTPTAFRLRRGGQGDLPELVELYNHYVRTSSATFDTEVFDEASRLPWFERFGLRPHWQLLVAEGRDGQLLGYASSGPFMAKPAYDSSVETSIYVGPDWLHQGIGAALYAQLFGALHGTRAHRAYAGITLPNEASMRLHTRFGFRPTATFSEVGHKFGRFWDVCWMEKAL